MAASMASVIAMAGDEIIMADNALLMIHNPWTVSIGDSDQLRKDAELMDKMKSAIINAYGRSNYSQEELEELMNAETWFTADEAIDAGFVDGTTQGLKAAASISELAACAKQVGATLPVEKIVAGVVTKYEKQIDDLVESWNYSCDKFLILFPSRTKHICFFYLLAFLCENTKDKYLL